jgi:hypothetical protein
MPPFSLSDDELAEITTLAACVPIEHRASFLQAVAAAVSKYPEGSRGPGLLHREARMLQRQFIGTMSLGAVARSRAWWG